MIKIGIIIGSTRPGRKAEIVASGLTTLRENARTPNSNLWTSRTSIFHCLTNPCRQLRPVQP